MNTDTQQGEYDVKTEAEIRVYLQVKEYQKLPPHYQKLKERQETAFLIAFGRNKLKYTLIFEPLE